MKSSYSVFLYSQIRHLEVELKTEIAPANPSQVRCFLCIWPYCAAAGGIGRGELSPMWQTITQEAELTLYIIKYSSTAAAPVLCALSLSLFVFSLFVCTIS